MAENWKPGDVAMVEAFWRQMFCQSEGAVRREGGWVSLLDGSYKPDGDEIKSVRPLLVIDPEDREQVERVVEAFNTSGFHRGSMPKHDALAGARRALRTLANPAPAIPDGLHVAPDGNDDLTLWDGTEVVARQCGVSERAWELLLAAATRQTDERADTPTDRPFKVGDRVRVADDGSVRLVCTFWRDGDICTESLDGLGAHRPYRATALTLIEAAP